jgi:hypothetical protein
LQLFVYCIGIARILCASSTIFCRGRCCCTDDLLLLAKKSQKPESLKAQLSSEFQMADMGPVAWFLGMRIRRLQDASYRLDQSRYIEDLLQKFQASSASPGSTPMEAGFINTLRKSTTESL